MRQETSNMRQVTRDKRHETRDKKFIFLVACFLSLVAIPASVSAATLYFKGDVLKSGNFSKLQLKILVDSVEPLNAYKLAITYPERLLRFENINDSRSIIDIWRSSKRPVTPGIIEFEGGGFDSFSGRAGEIVTVNFLVVGAGSSELKFANITAYVADGSGNLAQTNFINAPLTIHDISLLSPEDAAIIPVPEIIETADPNPPEIKFFQFEPDSNLFIFLVKDNESGFSKAMIRAKSLLSLSGWSEWKEVSSPYALTRGVWVVDFRAYDNAGNTTERRLYLWRVIIPVISFIAIVLIILAIVIHRRGKKYKMIQ